MTSIIVPVGSGGRWSADLGALAPGSRPLRIRSRSASSISAWRDQSLLIPTQFLREATWDFDFINQRAWIENVRGQGVTYDLAGMLAQLTFTRASAGYRFDATGKYLPAATDALRFDYHPVTLAPRGILIEGARTNLCTYGNDISNAAWTKSDVSVINNLGLSKDGTLNADYIAEAATTANHFVLPATAILATATVYTMTALARSTTRSLQIELGSPRFGANAWANFDLINGVVGTVGASAEASIESLGNSWYRVSITATTTSAGNGTARFSIVTGAAAAKSESYLGNGTSGVFLTFVQMEAGAGSSYIGTTATSATRAADVLTAAVGSWFNPTAGTLIAEWDVPEFSAGSNTVVVQVDDGTTGERLGILGQSSGDVVSALSRTAATTVANLDLGATAADTVERATFAWSPDDYAACRNGGAVAVDTLGAVPTGLTTLRLGVRSSDVDFLFGHVRRVSYIPRRVSNAELQALAA